MPTTPTISASRSRFYERPGAWFWTLVAIGAAARAFLACATVGSADVVLWSEHASGVELEGLVSHYATDELFNHPPLISWLISKLYVQCTSLQWPFRAVFRLLISASDLASLALIAAVLRASRWRWVAAGLYAVAPIAIVLSGHHGNTDAVIATCLLGCTLLASRGKVVATGVLLGVSAWIKLPGLLAAPVFGFAFPRWRDRVLCALIAFVVGVSTYFPTWFEARSFVVEHPELVAGPIKLDAASAATAPNLVWQRVFLYRGMYIHAPDDPVGWIWGLKSLLGRAWGAVSERTWPSWALWWGWHNVAVSLAVMLVFAFLRRRATSAPELSVTIAGVYALFYAGVESWSFQYFAWSMPFWMLAGWRYALSANLLGGLYVYAVYAMVCRDWLLRARWEFNEFPTWPEPLKVFRDIAWASFALFALYWFGRAVVAEIQLRARAKN